MKFQPIDEYMLSDKAKRQNHIDLNDSCIEIGTNSQECRALLAFYLMTIVPRDKNICLCHACNNEKCSNVKHLYWGTRSENIKDAFQSGRHPGVINLLEKKYSKEELQLLRSKAGKLGGKANKGINKSEMHKEKISISCRK